MSLAQANVYHCLIYVTNTNHTSHLAPTSECCTTAGGVQSFRLGDNARTGKGGGCVVFFVAADVITGRIMRDQYVRREDDRKGRMDPMSRSSLRSSPFSFPSSPLERNVGIAEDEVIIVTGHDATQHIHHCDDDDYNEDWRRRHQEEEEEDGEGVADVKT